MESRPDVALCGGAHQAIDNQGNRSGRSNLRPEAELDFDAVFLHRIQPPSAATLLFRTDCLREIGGYDPKAPLEDFDMHLRLTAAGYKLVNLPQILALYRRHGSNTMRQHQRILESILYSLGKYADHPEAVNYERASFVLKAAKADKEYARSLLQQIPLRYYSWRVIRGIFRLWFSR